MSSYQAREKFQEIPLCPCRFQHCLRIDSHFMKNNGQFIHKCNVNIPLAVFDHLCRFGYFDGFRTVDSGLHHEFIYLCHRIQRLLVHPGHDLGNRLQPVYFVPGIDPFRRIADLEIHAAFQPGFLLQNRNANIFRHSGIYRGFEYDNGALRQILSQQTACPFYRRQIRRMVVIHRRRNRHNMKFRLFQSGSVCGKLYLCIPYHFPAYFIGRVYSCLIQIDFLSVQIKPYHFYFFCKSYCNGHTYISQTYQGKLLASVQQLFI